MRQVLWHGDAQAPDRPSVEQLAADHGVSTDQVHERPGDEAGTVDLYFEGPETTA